MARSRQKEGHVAKRSREEQWQHDLPIEAIDSSFKHKGNGVITLLVYLPERKCRWQCGSCGEHGRWINQSLNPRSDWMLAKRHDAQVHAGRFFNKDLTSAETWE
jgi:hypothetical protein